MAGTKDKALVPDIAVMAMVTDMSVDPWVMRELGLIELNIPRGRWRYRNASFFFVNPFRLGVF